MDIEKAISFLKNSVTRDSGFSPVFIANMDIVIGYVEEKLTDRWIPVSEGLPEYNKPVLLFMDNGKEETKQVVGYLFHTDKEEFKAFNGEFSVDIGTLPDFLVQTYIKAWKPLTDSYEGEK